MLLLTIPFFFQYFRSPVIPAINAKSTPKLMGNEVLVLVATVSPDDELKVESALRIAGIPFESDGSVLTGYRVRTQDLERTRAILKADSIRNSYRIRFSRKKT